ncbi:hypothetical protein TNCV_557241 [Trichonephila clavipes]|uniref:Uncharacterized protein n=1 Tax=Trichonephila clavipes TaxID=2585209 RepID=A0A8X6RR49_TRICX|nr:hypothetical protein TNCV_557241 [Trichonephila clavipes]
MVSDRGLENSTRQRSKCVHLSLVVALGTMKMTIHIVTHLPHNFMENILQGVRYLPPLFHHRHEKLAARRQCRVRPCSKDTIHFQTSRPSRGFKPSSYG